MMIKGTTVINRGWCLVGVPVWAAAVDGGESGAEDPGRSPWTTGPLIPQCPSPVTCATVLAQSKVTCVELRGRAETHMHACSMYVRTPAKKSRSGIQKKPVCLPGKAGDSSCCSPLRASP